MPAGDLLPPVPADHQRTGVVDNTIQMVIFNDFDGIRADTFILIARLQENDTVVNLWYDSALLVGQALYDFIDYKLVSLGLPETAKNRFISDTLRAIRASITGSGSTWPEGIAAYLKNPRNFSREELNWLEDRILPDLSQAEENREKLLKHIEDNLSASEEPRFTIELQDSQKLVFMSCWQPKNRFLSSRKWKFWFKERTAVWFSGWLWLIES